MSVAAAQAECRDQPCRTQHSGQVTLEMSLARCQMRSQCLISHSAERSQWSDISCMQTDYAATVDLNLNILSVVAQPVAQVTLKQRVDWRLADNSLVSSGPTLSSLESVLQEQPWGHLVSHHWRATNIYDNICYTAIFQSAQRQGK